MPQSSRQTLKILHEQRKRLKQCFRYEKKHTHGRQCSMKGIRMIEGMEGGWEEFLDVNEGNNNGITTRESGVDEYGRVYFCFDS